MNLRECSDKQLHQNLLTLRSKELHIVSSIISHLEEVYRRRLFASYKCSSIYDYCIRILGYSNGETHRKVSACKLATQCHGVKESIAKGELSLSNAASVQVFLNQNQKSQKKIVLSNNASVSLSSSTLIHGLNAETIVERVKNKSTRECEIELEKIAIENHLGAPAQVPSRRHFGDKTLLKIYLDRDQLQLLKTRLNISCEQELLQALIEEKLLATEPRTEIRPRTAKKVSQRPRNISPAKRAFILKRAHKKCENCGSKHYLQIDHKLSVARGGGNDIENLRVLCRSCNQRAAIIQLGQKTRAQFINAK